MMGQQPGDEQHRGKGAEIDGEIEPAEHPRHQLLVGGAELVADVRCHAGFDAACADRDQSLPQEQPQAGVVQGQDEVAQAVDQ